MTAEQAPATDRIELLRRFAPTLRYDSNEQFFADSAAQFCANPGNELRRAPAGGKRSGTVIAAAVPTGEVPQLALAFLGSKVYADGTAVASTDVIGVGGKDYRGQYVRLRTSHPELSNRIYGRAAELNGRLWLQYWFWYFYNDYQLALEVGTHEGDWEMIQLRMRPERDEPDVAVYAQHRHGERRAWVDVEKAAGKPDTAVVYVARGSHASYFEAGCHQTDAWYDVADGKRPAPALALEIVKHDEHAWMGWPGRWGDTTPRDRGADLDQSSPTGPAVKRPWRNPDSLLDNARSHPTRPPPRAPEVTIGRMRSRIQIEYDFSDRSVRPRALVVTVNSRNERGVPPMTHTFDVAGTPRATLKTSIAVEPSRHYDVYASTVAGDPPIPSASQFTELEAIETEQDAATAMIAQAVGAIFARLRGDR